MSWPDYLTTYLITNRDKYTRYSTFCLALEYYMIVSTTSDSYSLREAL